jgi:polyhydroxybutyrate depolymerase
MKPKTIFPLLITFLIASLISSCGAISPVPTFQPTSTPLPPTPLPWTYPEPGDYIKSFEIQGSTRWVLIHIPPDYQAGQPIPLVINIHGRTSSIFQQDEISGMINLADQEGFIVAYPQAIDNPPTWWGAVPGEIGQADLAFFTEMIEHLTQEINIDPDRVYATGFSNGASMANRLGCAFSDTFAAIAPVAGGHVGFYDCEAEHPVSVIAIHGMNDLIIPYDGNQNNPQVHEWITAWAERNGCRSTPTQQPPSPGIIQEVWDDCDQDADVVLYSLEEAGHTWPGSDFSVYPGGQTDLLNATDLIWAFFDAHPKSSGPE